MLGQLGTDASPSSYSSMVAGILYRPVQSSDLPQRLLYNHGQSTHLPIQLIFSATLNHSWPAFQSPLLSRNFWRCAEGPRTCPIDTLQQTPAIRAHPLLLHPHPNPRLHPCAQSISAPRLNTSTPSQVPSKPPSRKPPPKPQSRRRSASRNSKMRSRTFLRNFRTFPMMSPQPLL